jgi:type II secretory pathway component PulJ
MIAKKLWLSYCFLRTCQHKQISGISLVELLVSILIASIAISGLLAAMVELLQTDQQEAMREETQQEMQAALNFISEDLRESVYVYDGEQTRGGNTLHNVYEYLPNFDAIPAKPILAFWKAEPISAEQEKLLANNSTLKTCNFSDPNKAQECRSLKSRRRTYTLVVYLQSTNPDPTWKGKSRILRYELPTYTSSNFASLTKTQGFVDPIDSNNFPTWPFNAQNVDLQAVSPQLGNSPPEVLVDFVDAPSSDDPENPDISQATYCSDKFGDDYERAPKLSNNPNSKSFFACVRKIGNALGQNQDIVLYVRGNTYGKGGVDKEKQFPLQTRVTLRGVIDKFN